MKRYNLTELAKELGIPGTGGSDAHRDERIGFCATQFTTSIKNEVDLIREIRLGNISPVMLRKS